MTDSETRIHKINVSGGAVFPDTSSVRFDGSNNTLLGLLDLKAPLDKEQKVPIEHLPEAFVRDSYFSGAKVGASSHTMVAEKNVEQYVSLDHKFYDYESYTYAEEYGYKFCVIKEGIYGLGLYLKMMHGYNASTLKVRARVEKSTGPVYEVSLIDKSGSFGGTTEFLYTGVIELFLEEADCVFFTVEQDRAGGRIWGGHDTYATIHRVVKIPEASNLNSNVVTDGAFQNCEEVQDCFWCPDGITDVDSNFLVTAPEGYSETDVYNDLRVSIDNINCKLSLDGSMELPTPIWPAECSAEDLAACMCTSNLTPEDLCLTFSNEQIMAIAGGYATLADLKSSIDNIKDTICSLVEPCINTYMDENICNIVTEKCSELVTDSELGCSLVIVQPDNGTITAYPDKVTYQRDEVVELTLVPDPCYEITNWDQDASGTALTTNVTIDKTTVTVGVNLTKKLYTLTLADLGPQGTLTATQSCEEDGKYACGETVRITLDLDTGWSLTEWTNDAVGTSAAQNYVDIVISGDATISANLAEDGVSKIICPFDNGDGASTGATGYKGMVRITISGWGSAYPATLSDAFYKMSWSESEGDNYSVYKSNAHMNHSNFDWKMQMKLNEESWIAGIGEESKYQYPVGDGVAESGGNYPAMNWNPSTEPSNGAAAVAWSQEMMSSTPAEGDREYTFEIDTGSSNFTRIWFRMYDLGNPSIAEDGFDSWEDNTGRFWIKVEPISGGTYGTPAT